MSRIWVLTCSTRALEGLFVAAASTRARCSVMRRASLMKGSRRHRVAPFSHASSRTSACSAGTRFDLAQLVGERVGAVRTLVGVLDASGLELLAFGRVGGVLPARNGRP